MIMVCYSAHFPVGYEEKTVKEREREKRKRERKREKRY